MLNVASIVFGKFNYSIVFLVTIWFHGNTTDELKCVWTDLCFVSLFENVRECSACLCCIM